MSTSFRVDEFTTDALKAKTNRTNRKAPQTRARAEAAIFFKLAEVNITQESIDYQNTNFC